MEFEPFPNFIGNGWASGMEIETFEVVSKTPYRSAFPKMEPVGMQGNGLRVLRVETASFCGPLER